MSTKMSKKALRYGTPKGSGPTAAEESRPVMRKFTMSLSARPSSALAKAGMRPVPSRMTPTICSRVRRAATSASDGAIALPWRFSPWQLAQFAA